MSYGGRRFIASTFPRGINGIVPAPARGDRASEPGAAHSYRHLLDRAAAASASAGGLGAGPAAGRAHGSPAPPGRRPPTAGFGGLLACYAAALVFLRGRPTTNGDGGIFLERRGRAAPWLHALLRGLGQQATIVLLRRRGRLRRARMARDLPARRDLADSRRRRDGAVPEPSGRTPHHRSSSARWHTR